MVRVWHQSTARAIRELMNRLLSNGSRDTLMSYTDHSAQRRLKVNVNNGNLAGNPSCSYYYLLSPSILFLHILFVLHLLFHCTFYSLFLFFYLYICSCVVLFLYNFYFFALSTELTWFDLHFTSDYTLYNLLCDEQRNLGTLENYIPMTLICIIYPCFVQICSWCPFRLAVLLLEEHQLRHVLGCWAVSNQWAGFSDERGSKNSI